MLSFCDNLFPLAKVERSPGFAMGGGGGTIPWLNGGVAARAGERVQLCGAVVTGRAWCAEAGRGPE